MSDYKICSYCKEEKKKTEFYKNRTARSGLQANCKKCATTITRNWQRDNSEKQLTRSRAWKKANPEKVRQGREKWYSENSEKVLAAGRDWYAKNIEEQRARLRKWASENIGKRSAVQAKRKAAQMQRTPKWLTKEDFKTMSFIYELARGLTEATGIPHHVDHEYPMQGEFVSGLHVPQNLQILTAYENVSKKNGWAPE